MLCLIALPHQFKETQMTLFYILLYFLHLQWHCFCSKSLKCGESSDYQKIMGKSSKWNIQENQALAKIAKDIKAPFSFLSWKSFLSDIFDDLFFSLLFSSFLLKVKKQLFLLKYPFQLRGVINIFIGIFIGYPSGAYLPH